MIIWKEIKDYPMYSVSNTGFIKSTQRNRILILTPGITRKGYKRARLTNGKSRSIFVHRLVAEAFIPNHRNLSQINHKDTNKLNNHVDNLEWCSQSVNMQHAYDHGLKVQYQGSKHGRAKLTEAQVIKIRAAYIPKKVTITSLANQFGVSKSMIGYIVKNQNWTHI